MTALLKRVESARGGNDDDAIAERRAINAWLHDNLMPEPKVVVPLNYCSSLDAAVSLCERLFPNPDWFWRVSTINGGANARICDMRVDHPEKEFYGSGKTPALALVLATLRAVEK